MNLYQPTLINFGHITLLHDYATQNNIKLVISKNGVLHTERKQCPRCDGGLCSYNGSNKTGHIISRSEDIYFKVGQQYCPHCGKTIQIENDFIVSIKHALNQFILSETLSLRGKFMSYADISSHMYEVHKIKIDDTTLKTICENRFLDFENLEFDYEIEDGFYGYDEQYIRVNGKLVYRIVIYDCKNNCVIYEAKHETLTKKILKQILEQVFGDEMPKGFIFDMKTMYPNAFREVFGKKIKLQYCVFHLNKLILKEYGLALKVGKKSKWSIVHYLNLYSLFNIFYNREQELNLLKEFQKDLSDYKEKLIDIEDLDGHKKDVSFPKKCKTDDEKRVYLVRVYEKELMKKFREHLHAEKLRRRRDKETLKVRTKEDAKNKLDKLIRISNWYPKKIEARIQKIKKNFELFTGSDGAHLTNNRLEGFFGATLKGTRKKGFRSDKALENFFKFQKLKASGVKMFESFSISQLAMIFGIVAALPFI